MKDLTKQAISNSLQKLLRDRPISQISVKDVCADCGLNRQTFYYHFQDIYDLLFWNLRKDMINYFHAFSHSPADFSGFLYALFLYCTQNSKLVRHAYNPALRVRYETAFRDATGPILKRRIESYENYHLVSEEDVELLVSFYAFSAASLLFRWVESGMPESFQANFSKYCQILDQSVDALLLKFSK